MQIVIDIPDDIYQHIAVFRHFSTYDKKYLIDAFKNCTALPENHGRLIDADILNLYNISPVDDEYFSVYGVTAEDIDNAPTIIEGTEGKE